ncbi:MAG TPA: peptide chain release factor 1 [Chloroflexota bacterium]
MLERLAEMDRRYQELTKELTRPEVLADPKAIQQLGREQATLEPTVARYRDYLRVRQQLAEARALIEEERDEELRALAREEIEALQARRATLVAELREALRPRDPNDDRDVIVEIRAGTGGEEASLFAADLFRMYARYAERQGWKVELLSTSPTDLGGFREVIFEVKGHGAYSRFKHESGVHRVQRVPVTEASGRIHTSTATVAVLPEPDEVEVNIDEEDLEIEVFRSGGHGGQSVNTTDSAVRITHRPTGIVVSCQDERSQLKNKMKAMAVLRARLYELELRKHREEISSTRRAQVGSGERAEKIRTYNFPQDRVTDHRIGLTLHNLGGILDGELDTLVDALTLAAEKEPVKT